jgi:RNA polymerase sigma factor (sigma-70 family)
LDEHTIRTSDFQETMSSRVPDHEAQDLNRTLELVQRAQGDDREALDELFARYYGLVRRIVLANTGEALKAREDVDDIVQVALFDVFKALDRFEYRSHEEFVGFLAKVTVNAIRTRGKFYKAQKRKDDHVFIEQLKPSVSESCEVQVPAEQTGPATMATRNDEFSHVMDCALELPQTDRALLALYLMYGEDWMRIGKELGIDNDAARMRWARIRERVGSLVERRGRG